MLSMTFAPVGAGALFGSALTASRVYLPTVIIKQMQLQDFHMLQVFLTACATSAIVVIAFERLGVTPRKVRSSSSFGWLGRYDANIFGGLLIGLGMALTGACPGTVVVQVATGIKSGLYVASGGILGGIFFSRFGSTLKNSESTTAAPEAHTIASKLHFDPTMTFVAFEIMCAAIVAMANFLTPAGSYGWVHPIAGGLLIGVSQAASLTLTSSPLGVSGVYGQIGQYFWRTLGQKDHVATPPSPPSAILFAVGMLAGSAATARSIPPVPSAVLIDISNLRAITGGFLMVLGASSAGGCTSGHGISGLAAFSFSSLVTVAAMFGGGIATALVL